MSEKVFHEHILGLIDLIADTLDWLKDEKIESSLSGISLRFFKSFMKNDENSLHDNISTFISKSYAYWPSIKKRDEEFLSNNAGILFEGVDETYINELNRLFLLKDENGDFLIPTSPTRESIWKYIECLVKDSIKYIHQYRSPDPETKKYRRTYFGKTEDFEGISVRENATIWNVKL